MVSKLESALGQQLTATVKADSAELKVQVLGETIKKHIPAAEKDRQTHGEHH